MKFLFLLAWVAGCAPSEDEIKREFGELVDGANTCATPSDCTLVYPGCPLGCTVAVRADRADELQRKARDLISDYERGGQSCQYDCVGVTGATCVEQRCAVVFTE